ncbi:putative geranylgeranyl diphosphate synthase [Aspergillus californicus]
MQSKFSTLVDPATYDAQGLNDGLPVRYHNNPEHEDTGALRCQEHWKQWVGPLGVFKGALAHPWSLISITIPECLPERLDFMGYMQEFCFLHDAQPARKKLTFTQEGAHNEDLKAAFAQVAGTGAIEHASSGKRAMQAYMGKELMRRDPERAIPILKAWIKFADFSGRQEGTRFTSEKEYLKYRLQDFGTVVVHDVFLFAMALTIPDSEKDIRRNLAGPAYLYMMLVNDLFSWEKEKQTAAAMGKDFCTNIIFVLMQEHGIPEGEAKERCREKIRNVAANYQQIVAETKANASVSHDTKVFLEALLYAMSGFVVWCQHCPRYNRSASFSDRQVDWMKNGIPKEPREDAGQVTVNGNGSSIPLPMRKIDGNSDLLSTVTKDLLDGCDALKLGDHDVGVHLHKGPAPDTEQILQAPYDYITALPSKRLREQAIDALNAWCHLPASKLEIIKSILTILHNASLMLDDLEDGSDLRRGKPATHTIFGLGQTVNSANYQLVRALREVQKLGDPRSLLIFTDELENLATGQAMDLYWTSNLICPSLHEYFAMIDNKTGGLFRLLARLMALHSTSPIQVDLTDFTNRLGRYFQTRDDYQNLVSAEYTKQKGFCEDFEEGKFSLPMIHLMQALPNNYVLKNLLTQRRVKGTATHAQKQTLLDLMKQSGSLQFTKDFLHILYSDLKNSLAELDRKFGVENFQLRLILELLQTE